MVLTANDLKGLCELTYSFGGKSLIKNYEIIKKYHKVVLSNKFRVTL